MGTLRTEIGGCRRLLGVVVPTESHKVENGSVKDRTAPGQRCLSTCHRSDLVGTVRKWVQWSTKSIVRVLWIVHSNITRNNKSQTTLELSINNTFYKNRTLKIHIPPGPPCQSLLLLIGSSADTV